MKTLLRKMFAAAVLLLALVGGMTGYCAWRLSQGPIALDWLRPRIEASVRAAQPSLALQLGSVDLWWNTQRRRPELRARDVRVRSGETVDDLNLGTLVIHPRVFALLRGEIVLHHLTVVAPQLHLLRSAEGVGLQGIARPQSTASASSPRTVATALRALHGVLATVGHVELRDGTITVDDQMLAHSWNAEQVEGKLSIVDSRIDVQLATQLRSGAFTGTVRLTGAETSDGGIQVDARAENVVPAQIVDAFPPGARLSPPPALHQALRAVRSPLNANTQFVVGPERTISGPIRVAVAADGLVIDDSQQGLRLSNGKLQLSCDVDGETGSLQIKPSVLEFSDLKLQVNGSLTRRGSVSQLEINAAMPRLRVDALKRYWPTKAAAEARHWVTGNITNGIVTDVGATIRLDLADDVRLASFTGKGRFDDLQVRFAPEMPPAVGVRGTIAASDTDYAFAVDHARIEALEVPSATVRILPPSEPEPLRIEVEVHAHGPLASAVAVLNHEPVALSRSVSVTPDDVGGNLTANVYCTIPLGKGTPPATFGGSARVENASLHQPINGWPVSNGNFDIRLGKSVLDADGHVNVAAVPTTINLHHTLGTDAATVRAHATLDENARKTLGADLGNALTGSVPVTATIMPTKGSRMVIDVEADLSGSKWSPPMDAFAKATDTAGHASARIFVPNESSMVIDYFNINAGGTVASGRAGRGRDGWDQFHAQIRLPGNASATMDVSLQRQGANFALTAKSNDAGAVVNLLAHGEAQGGTLAFDGVIKTEGEMSLEGNLDIGKMRFIRAPVLAQLLTLGSVSGLKDLVMREGVRFDEIHAELTAAQGIVRVRDARADGDALAILAEGYFDTNRRHVDLNGTVIPSYYGLNAAPKKIPVLGPLVAKATGEAVQMIDARVHGSFDDPKVSIAPGSVVAPEMIKDKLRSWRKKLSGQRARN